MASTPSSETDAASSITALNLSDTTSNSSTASTCPHCYNDVNSPPRKTSHLHPVSIPNDHVEFDHFKAAANEALRNRFKGSDYDEVTVLLLNWKANDLALKTPEAGSLIKDETLKLKSVFENVYSFSTKYFEIPSVNAEPKMQLLLASTINELSDMKATGKKVLLIVYYNGHGAIKDGKLIWSARKSYNLKSSTNPALSWYSLQPPLENAEFDILLILDCCHAAGTVTKGVNGTMEVLAGCARETISRGPGGARSMYGSPFTHSLTRVLEEKANRPSGLLVTELQTFLSKDQVLEDQSPVHVFISGHYKPIKLRPIGKAAAQGSAQDPPGDSMTSTAESELKALLAISFYGQVLSDVEEFVDWLNSQHPKEVSRIEVERVGIEGSFDSCSTLVLLSMPIHIWARLKECSGTSLVGFVKSRNLSLNKYEDNMTSSKIETAQTEYIRRLDTHGQHTANLVTPVVDPVFHSREAERSNDGLSTRTDAQILVNSDWDLPRISMGELHITVSKDIYSAGWLGSTSKNRQVIVEWAGVQSGFNIAATGYSQLLKRIILRWSQLRSAVKEQKFLILQNLGHCLDLINKRIGIISAWPLDHPGETFPEPKSLHDVLISPQPEWKLSLQARFQLAHTLANYLLHFHSQGVFHKNLSPDSIRFFPSSMKEADVVDCFKRPYLMGLFTEKRSNALDMVLKPRELQPEYLHPNLRPYIVKDSYIPIYDYYSLGIVLLEIGLWKSFRGWWPYAGNEADSEKRLLDRFVVELKRTMGDRYCRAVELCLWGEWKNPNSKAYEETTVHNAYIHDMFKKEVVDALAIFEL